MKMKKLSLVIMSLLLAAPTLAKTTITPYVEFEQNDYTNSAKETDKNKDGSGTDYTGVGFKFSQTLTEKTSVSGKIATYDYDEFSDKKIQTNSYRRTELFLNNKVLSMDNGFKLDIALGTRNDEYTATGKNLIDYRFKPKWSYPLADKWKLSGSWLFYKQKDTSGKYWYRHELETGVTYSGFKSVKLYGGFYDEQKTILISGDDSENHYMQLRGKLYAKVGDVSVTPWVRLALGEADKTNSNGSDGDGDTTNRYGVDVSKKINGVKYAAQVYYQTARYDDSMSDKNRTYGTVSATDTLK